MSGGYIMSERVLIEPDVDFIHCIREQGGEPMKLCCQCATCSVTCQLAPVERPFPRKEMIWVQWGLKERLLSDPDVWLCHQCNDCSINCPRQSKPGDILATLREYIFQHFAYPKFMGKIVSSPKYLPVFFLIPILIILVVTSIFGNLSMPGGTIIYNKIFPSVMVENFFIAAFLFMFIFMGVSLLRFWKQLKVPGESNGKPPGSIVMSVIGAVKEILTHSKFNECSDNAPRQIGHLLVFYSFLGLATTSGILAVMMWFMDFQPPFDNLLHPVKILGNISAFVIVIGIAILLYMRASGSEKVGGSTYVDWLFISVLSFTVLTGILSQVFRLLELPAVTYMTYFVHLVFAFTLLLYLPYTKFAHILYRVTAIVFAKYTGR